MTDVAQSFGMNAVEITDDPWLIMHHAKYLAKNLPAFLDIHTVRILWHAGVGQDREPEWDRLTLIKEELKRLGLGNKAEKIERKTKTYIDGLWEKQLASHL